MNDTDVPFCVICHRVCDDDELNAENECVKCVGPATGPTPEGKVEIFGQEAFFHATTQPPSMATWEAELFPFKGVIAHNPKEGYEWRLFPHPCFGSHAVLGRGSEQEFRWSRHELEECAKAYFNSMRWFVETNGMRWFKEE